MTSSISYTLYLWLKEKRLMEAVAKRMGKPHSTLVAELKGAKYRSKLGADELVPLFQAIRETDYRTEFEGILKKYLRELGGEQTEFVSVHQFGTLLFSVMQSVATLSKPGDRIENLKTARELSLMKTKIRTEIVPAVYKLEAIVDDQLALMRERRSESRQTNMEPIPIHEGA